MRNNIKIIYVFFLCLLLQNCSSKKDDLKISSVSEKELYDRGVKEIKSEKYKDASKTLTQLEEEYPASKYYSEALVLKTYAFFALDNFTEAQLTIDDFLRQFPVSDFSPYIYYIKGMLNYKQIMDIGRDQEYSAKAKQDFTALIQLYPKSKYSKDARWKLEYINNVLAGKEMDIGRFYLRTHKPISAVNRFKNVLKNYDDSIFIPEALYRLFEIYYILGIEGEAKKYASVLGYNFPNSIWYYKSYNILKSS
ncbi:MAG: outer membrane protein assembly factor BamD [Candidatus Midichloriaceae bacterium]|jgi:outer membrane protein assembly factor BamD